METTAPPANDIPLMRNPERAAWGVILIAFAIFCTVCILSTVSVYVFFFQSTVPMNVVAQPSRGAIGVVGTDFTRQLVDTMRQLSTGNAVSPADNLSQAVMMFRDQYRDNRVIAMATLHGDRSSVSLVTSQRPRFDWGSASYQIELSDVRGRVDFVVSPDVGRGVDIRLRTQQGARLLLAASGRYAIESGEQTVVVSNDNGQLIVIPENQDIGYVVAAGATVRIMEGEAQPITQPAPVNLVENSHFESVLQTEGAASIPLNWACRPGVLNQPSSTFVSGIQDGRTMIRFLRGDGATTNGETVCQQGQPSGQVWRDVSGYSYLALRTSFYIAHQSLSLCGVRGSECPLMVRIEYLTADGDIRELIYGFYAYFDPMSNWPSRCDTCMQPHTFVKMQSWYTYETENIFAILPQEERPVAISSIRFYASGHEYDLRVAEMSLLAQ